MKWFEVIVRHCLFTFSAAAFVTFNFENGAKTFVDLPLITWVLFILLFALSWRLKKEFLMIFVHKNGEDDSLWAQFEKQKPLLATITWQAVLTLAALHVTYLVLDLLGFIEVDGIRVKLFGIAVIITFIFRLLDKDSYKK